MTMKKTFGIVVAFAVVMFIVNPVIAEWRWQHYGIEPYAASKAEAMKERGNAFRQLNLPSPVIAQLLLLTERPGITFSLSKGDRLTGMLSKGGVLHEDVVVAFPPPDGVPGMQYVATAEKWQTTWEGKLYTVILPEVCFNWSDIIAPAPAPPQAVAPPSPAPPKPLEPTISRTLTGQECPAGWSVTAHAWSLASIPLELRQKVQKLMDNAHDRDSGYGTKLPPYRVDDVSRTLGKRLRMEVKIHAPVTADIKIRYLDVDPTSNQLSIREIGVLHMVNGTGTFRFPDDPRQHTVVGSGWSPAVDGSGRLQNFKSPEVSGGEPRLRIFRDEWVDCDPNMHGIVP